MGAPAMEAPRLWHWNDVSLPPQQTQEKPWLRFGPVSWKWSIVRSIELLDDVRFGSKADIEVLPPDVRFTPKSEHCFGDTQCPLCANSGHWPASGRLAVPRRASRSWRGFEIFVAIRRTVMAVYGEPDQSLGS